MAIASTPDAGNASVVEVERCGETSRLTTCRSTAPLKLLNPRSAGYCSVILSSYGGGFVEGDSIVLSSRCGPAASLYLGTQAFGKVYRCPAGVGWRQQFRGVIETGGCVVAMPDPIVPYAGSIYCQRQHWSLHGDAVLVLLDCHTSGRVECGESFAYTEYRSDIDIALDTHTILLERYYSRPGAASPESPGIFGRYTVSLNAYLVGQPDSARFHDLLSRVERTVQPSTARRGDATAVDHLVTYSRPRPEVLVVRALGLRSESLDRIRSLLAEATTDLLGSNPQSRLP